MYWLNVDHGKNRARLHRVNGCHWVLVAVRRLQESGPTKKPKRSSSWEGPFTSIELAEANQRQTGKAVLDYCSMGACGAHFRGLKRIA